jgi:hypothetical protein
MLRIFIYIFCIIIFCFIFFSVWCFPFFLFLWSFLKNFQRKYNKIKRYQLFLLYNIKFKQTVNIINLFGIFGIENGVDGKFIILFRRINLHNLKIVNCFNYIEKKSLHLWKNYNRAAMKPTIRVVKIITHFWF